MTERVKLQLDLSEHQAMALAEMVKRICWEHIYDLCNRFDPYPDGRAEADHMLDCIHVLQRALREKGFAPR